MLTQKSRNSHLMKTPVSVNNRGRKGNAADLPAIPCLRKGFRRFPRTARIRIIQDRRRAFTGSRSVDGWYGSNNHLDARSK
jgi:hypothetical protein